MFRKRVVFSRLSILSTVTCISLSAVGAPTTAKGWGLERTQIDSFHLTEVKENGARYLHIRGRMPLHSMCNGVTNLKMKNYGAELNLRTELEFSKRPIPFDFFVTVPDFVNKVTFGPSREEIWPHAHSVKLFDEQMRALTLASAIFQKKRPDADLNDYYVFLEKPDSPACRGSDDFFITFEQDGPAYSALRERYRIRLKRDDYSVVSISRWFDGGYLAQTGKSREPHDVP